MLYFFLSLTLKNRSVSILAVVWKLLSGDYIILNLFNVFKAVSMTEKSWLHWSYDNFAGTTLNTKFPWLKSHGSIEAHPANEILRKWAEVSMTEKSWLHWSGRLQNGLKGQHSVSMTEKSWLHWSNKMTSWPTSTIFMFPWLKSHGSIEATVRKDGTTMKQ